MKTISKTHALALALMATALAAPAASLAQAPASWASRDGRWNDWKAGGFANSTAHFEALKAAAKGGVKHTKLTIPDWSGIWTAANNASGGPGWGRPRWVYTKGQGVSVAATPNSPEAPVLTPEYQKKLEDELERVSRGVEWDYLSYCLPAGYPRWHTEPFLKEYITAPTQTWMVNEMVSEVRRIYTDGRGHVPEDERYPTWTGDSIGFWDGDTLIVHTVGTKPGTWNRSAPAYSDKTETVELVRKNAAGLIEVRLTAYDSEALQKPWHLIFGARKVDLSTTPNLRIDMWSCAENNNVVKTAEGVTQFVLPGESGYKDPNALTTPPPS